jgi:hypothetical protein
MYFENVDSFGGQGAFIQKFGLMVEQSATLVVARRRWEQFVGRYGATTVPTRPNEGDLIYFPLSKGLFEIKFVQHQDPFYQLGKLYVYKLQVELFQYASEAIDTGIAAIDTFETLKTFNTNTTRNPNGEVTKVNITDGGSGYNTATVNVTSSSGYGAVLTPVINNGVITAITIDNAGTGYQTPPLLNIVGDGFGGAATAEVEANVDKPSSFGDNNKFKEEASAVINFDESNPFGEIQ